LLRDHNRNDSDDSLSDLGIANNLQHAEMFFPASALDRDIARIDTVLSIEQSLFFVNDVIVV